MACPIRKDGEALREDAGAPNWTAGCRSRAARTAQAVRFDDVSRCDDDEHQPELEALDNICARELEKIVLFDFLEDCRLDFYELIRHQEGQKCIGIGIDGNVQSDDLIEQCRSVNKIINKSQEE